MPEYFEPMHQYLVEITMMDVDENKDGVVFVEEYVNSVARSQRLRASKRNNLHGSSGNEEDKFDENDYRRELEYFFSHRDVNKDGIMDVDEMRDWILPKGETEPGVREAAQLFAKVDANEDELLSLEEVKLNQNVFMQNAYPSYFVQLYQNSAANRNEATEEQYDDDDDDDVSEDSNNDQSGHDVLEEDDADEILDHSDLETYEHIEL